MIDEPTLTDLVLKATGVKVVARGGNGGMDDSRKRVSREHSAATWKSRFTKRISLWIPCLQVRRSSR